jgi:hypothetical protein
MRSDDGWRWQRDACNEQGIAGRTLAPGTASWHTRPSLSEELSQESPELLGICQAAERAVKTELVTPEQPLQSADELASEDFA